MVVWGRWLSGTVGTEALRFFCVQYQQHADGHAYRLVRRRGAYQVGNMSVADRHLSFIEVLPQFAGVRVCGSAWHSVVGAEIVGQCHEEMDVLDVGGVFVWVVFCAGAG